MELVGHTSLVYSVDSHKYGLIASGSEDCFLKIWRGCFLLFHEYFLFIFIFCIKDFFLLCRRMSHRVNSR